MLAAAHFGREFPTAAPLAYSILDRARSGGACLPQLNLAFLLSTHERPRDDATAAEFRKAERELPRRSDAALAARAVPVAAPPSPAAGAPEVQCRRRPSSAGCSPRSTASSGASPTHRPAGRARRMPSCAPAISSKRGSPSPPVAASGVPCRSTARPAGSTPTRDRGRRGPRLCGAAALRRRGSRPAAGDYRHRRPAQLEARLIEYLERDRHFAEAAAGSRAAGSVATVPDRARAVHADAG